MQDIDDEKLLKIKEDAIQNFVPILKDDTMEKIEEKLNMVKPSKILEIGTAVGYSAIKFSKYLTENGIIDTIERNEKRYNKAIENIKYMGLEDKINVIFGDATEQLKLMKENEKYDVIFIDAAKGQYLVFLEEAKRLVRKGGLIIADNVLWHGLVKSDYNEHRHRTAVTRLRKFLEEIEKDESLNSEVLDIGDGLAIIIKER